MNRVYSATFTLQQPSAVARRDIVPSRPLLVIDLLRRFFLDGPTDEVLGLALAAAEAIGGTEQMAAASVALAKAADEGVEGGEDWISDLDVEFTRLLIGPAQTPAVPYASFYLSPGRLVMTEETLAVRRRYADAGIARRADVHLPDDHLGLELDFLFYLERELTLANAAAEHPSHLRDLTQQRDAFVAHLSSWVPAFSRDVLGATTHPFVISSITLLLSLLSSEKPA